jgi:L-aminopeptidase/D-esterase-like protein
MALGVQGVRIGTWTAPGAVSGCTVVLPPAGSVGAMAVRGAAPGTREAVALSPAGKVDVCHAVVLAGGSAYGLAAADGVMRRLERDGVGYPVLGAVVPIVGAAIVLDAAVLDPSSRPDAAAGEAAYDAATEDGPFADGSLEGRIGAGAGCSVAKVAGLEHAWRSGQGVATRRAGGVSVGVLIVNNALGEIVDEDGRWIARARVPDDVPRYPDVGPAAGPGAGPAAVPGDGGRLANTVIGVVVTDARLTKLEAHRVADLAHSGIARAVRPAHTQLDGDALFTLATGTVDAGPTAVDLVAALAADAVAEAVRRAVRAAKGDATLPGLADGPPDG